MNKRMIYCGYCGKEHQYDSAILAEHQRLLGSDPRTYGAPIAYEDFTKEEKIAKKAAGLVGKEVVIKKVDDPMISQYSFAVGKKGKVESVSPRNIFPINVRLENGLLLSFAEEEIELTA